MKREKLLSKIASKDTKVEIEAAKVPVPSIESSYEGYLTVPDTCRIAIEAEKKGFHALIPGCYGDPGLEAIREIVKIPVVGLGVTSAHMASLLGEKFSIITSGPKRARKHRLKGLGDKLVSIRGVGLTVLECRENRDKALESFTEQGSLAIEEDGADVVILGCMSLAYQNMDEELSERLGVPVINPIKVSIKIAEMLVSLGISHSKAAYPMPKKLY